ncbi:MAG: DnaB-like helicase C-terminal domain-containing protein [Bacteroidota bacterium]
MARPRLKLETIAEFIDFETVDKIISEEFELKDLFDDEVSSELEINIPENELDGVCSGFTQIDTTLSGFTKGKLAVVAARPGMGRTAFMISMAHNIAVNHQKSVCIYSIERTPSNLVSRWIESQTGLSADKIKKGEFGDLGKEKAYQIIRKIARAKIFILHASGVMMDSALFKTENLFNSHGIDIVLVDYLQMLKPDEQAESVSQYIGVVSQGLKEMADKLNIPVVAFSLANRSMSKNNPDFTPQLVDISEPILEFADTVMFIHRPEYYMITEDKDGNSLKGIAQIVVTRHRESDNSLTIPLRFIDKLSLFSDLN